MFYINFYPVVEPVINLLDALLYPLLALVGALGTIYCVFLGLKIAKIDEANSREKAKKDLFGAITGFFLIFILIVALKLLLPIMESWLLTW